MSAKGSPYARFQRALALGDLALVRMAAAELPHVNLDDALTICCLMAVSESPAFERAAVRWTARWILERPDAQLDGARRVLALFDAMPHAPDAARAALKQLAARP
ncbi:MAG: hypothetical protein QOG15_1669 [Solirubrobacteraceae bacterium]|jgi:hypothetical protein|nr:hypothetical protein [Solirubrobacteraceae bacterium]